MSGSAEPNPSWSKLGSGDGSRAIKKAAGVTASERYLQTLGERTFLSLWSYPGVFRNQHASGRQTGDGKEVCDLLVVFENHVIIFSDKSIAYPSGSPEVAWKRWVKKAVLQSAAQVYGAERWIRDYPDRLFVDRACTTPIPIDLPPAEQMKVHRVVVAHNVSEVCQRELGGSGSLMIAPSVVGKDHLDLTPPMRPFTIGQVDPARGFVHVLDDTTLDVVLTTLDTVSDFVDYLSRK